MSNLCSSDMNEIIDNSSTPTVVSKYHFPLKGTKVFWKLADSRSGAHDI